MDNYPVVKQHAYITKLGQLVAKSTPLSDEDREFLSSSLIEIGSGVDARQALGVKNKRGGTTLERQRELSNRDQLAMSWIAAATAKEDGGLGLTLDGAIDLLHKNDSLKVFGITEDTIRKYWNNRPRQRKRDVQLY